VSKSETFLAAVHPGEVLREDFMKPLSLTVNKLALELHVPATCIGEIITSETALRLARSFWTQGRNGAVIAAVVPLLPPVTAERDTEADM